MKLIRMLVALGLIVGSAVAADAAATVRTAPADPPSGGTAHCAVVNGGTKAGTITLTMFSFSDNAPLVSNNGIGVAPNQTQFGSPISTGSDPSWCECVLPNKTEFQCSFTVVNGINVTVVPAE